MSVMRVRLLSVCFRENPETKFSSLLLHSLSHAVKLNCSSKPRAKNPDMKIIVLITNNNYFFGKLSLKYYNPTLCELITS